MLSDKGEPQRVALNHVFFQTAGAVKCATKERRSFGEGTSCLQIFAVGEGWHWRGVPPLHEERFQLRQVRSFPDV